MKKIIILGSTGSIGKQTLEILKKDKKNFKIVLLSTDKNINLLRRNAVLLNKNKSHTISSKYLNFFEK